MSATTKPKRSSKEGGGMKTKSHLQTFVPDLPTLVVPFAPEVLRMLEIQAALMGPQQQPESLVNALVKAGAEYLTLNGRWWPASSPKVVGFQFD